MKSNDKYAVDNEQVLTGAIKNYIALITHGEVEAARAVKDALIMAEQCFVKAS